MAAARASLPLVLPPPASRGLAPCWHCCLSAKPAACHPQSAWPPVAVRGNFLVGVGGGERPRSLGEGHTDGCVVGWDPSCKEGDPSCNGSVILGRLPHFIPRTHPPPISPQPPTQLPKLETRASPSTPPPLLFSPCPEAAHPSSVLLSTPHPLSQSECSSSSSRLAFLPPADQSFSWLPEGSA